MVADRFIRFIPKDECPDLDSRVNKGLILEFNRRYSNLLRRNSKCRNFVVKNLRRRFKEESNKILPDDISTLTKRDVYDLLDLINRVSNCPEVVHLNSQPYSGEYIEQTYQKPLVTESPIQNVNTNDNFKPEQKDDNRLNGYHPNLNKSVVEKKTPQHISQNSFNFKPMNSSNNYGELSMTNITEVKNDYILPKFKYDEFYN